MANANSTLANLANYKAFNFVTIPSYFSNAAPKHYSAYTPIILMDCEYDKELGLDVGKSISLEPIISYENALEAACIACLSTDGAIGYAVRGVDHE